MDPILHILLVIAVVGVLVGLGVRFLGMPEVFNRILIGASAILVVLWILHKTGVL